MAIKVKIRIGELEIDYEGSEEFLKYEMPQLLSKITDVDMSSFIRANQQLDSSTFEDKDNGQPSPNPSTLGNIYVAPDMSLNTVAAHLNVKGGNDLTLAACIRLGIIVGKNIFTRQEILDEMKSANHYYEINHNKNLTGYLKVLVKNKRIKEVTNNQYSLSAETIKQAEAQLAK